MKITAKSALAVVNIKFGEILLIQIKFYSRHNAPHGDASPEALTPNFHSRQSLL
jgi:hypothetical protein